MPALTDVLDFFAVYSAAFQEDAGGSRMGSYDETWYAILMD